MDKISPLRTSMKKNGVPAKSELRHKEIGNSTRLAVWATFFLGIETNVRNGERSSLEYVYLTIHCSGKSAPLKASMAQCGEFLMPADYSFKSTLNQ